MEEKNLQLERLVFFCDAVVAIAITLLTFDIKIDHAESGNLTFKDLLVPWKSVLSFVLSFVNIASFWRWHHAFFAHIKKINEPLLWYNITWLFFIVLLPFSTSLLSKYFFDTPAVFLYSVNTFLITVFQNTIWDYASGRAEFLKQGTLNKMEIIRIRVYCNLDMLNAIVAIIVSFISPLLAFILLLTKIPMFLMASLFLGGKKKRIFPRDSNPSAKRKN